MLTARHIRYAGTLLALLALLLAATVTPALAGSGSSSQTDLREELEGDKIDGEEPRGDARFVEQVDGEDVTVTAPDGTVILAGSLEAH